ncbi:hypothetical protein PIB30_099625 [Stylosanthes scabra]|uniref:Uncharacterized protein n=1 Tax=Stylosanthes scabra TaxID=79078 RepID=A0ABU6TXN6_9FABA|nr:hypothetical protein [Stylosanthes scabra]
MDRTPTAVTMVATALLATTTSFSLWRNRAQRARERVSVASKHGGILLPCRRHRSWRSMASAGGGGWQFGCEREGGRAALLAVRRYHHHCWPCKEVETGEGIGAHLEESLQIDP